MEQVRYLISYLNLVPFLRHCYTNPVSFFSIRCMLLVDGNSECTTLEQDPAVTDERVHGLECDPPPGSFNMLLLLA